MSELINGFTGYSQRRAGEGSYAQGAGTGASDRTVLGSGARVTHDPQLQGAFARTEGSYGVVGESKATPRARLNPDRLEQIPGTDRRWAWVEIDQNALIHNVQCARRTVGSGTRVMGVVKNDAFGHGIVRVAKTAVSAGVDYLGVATIDEAIEVRQARINAPILLLSQPPVEAIPLLIAHKVMPTIYEAEFAVAYGETADRYAAAAPYHLAIDTGMNRIGIAVADALDFVRQTSFHRALELAGVYTQFSSSTDAETYEFARQFRRFVSVVGSLHDAGFDTGIVHCADTAASLRFPDSCLHMVRWGRGLYGIQPCLETRHLVDLHPVMSVHARIVDLRRTPMSEGVSFGARYRSAGNALICTLPIGYANGLPFSLSGRLGVLYDGMRCAQVGDICMDQCMFEVDARTSTSRALHNPRRGDEVVLVGRQGDMVITLEDLAHASGNTPAGLACAFGARLPHVYV